MVGAAGDGHDKDHRIADGGTLMAPGSCSAGAQTFLMIADVVLHFASDCRVIEPLTLHGQVLVVQWHMQSRQFRATMCQQLH